MKPRTRLPALSALFLLACTPRDSVPDGAMLVDEEIFLQAVEGASVVRRELTMPGRSIVVAQVREQTTDVRLTLALAATETGAPAAIEVENNLRGMGTEIAVLDVPRDSRIVLTLTGPRNLSSAAPVRLIVRRFSTDSRHAARLAGFRAWSAATAAAHRPTSFANAFPSHCQGRLESIPAQRSRERCHVLFCGRKGTAACWSIWRTAAWSSEKERFTSPSKSNVRKPGATRLSARSSRVHLTDLVVLFSQRSHGPRVPQSWSHGGETRSSPCVGAQWSTSLCKAPPRKESIRRTSPSCPPRSPLFPRVWASSPWWPIPR